MRRLFVVILMACTIGLLGTPKPEGPAAEELPAIELNRTAAASHVEPTSKRVLFVLIMGSDVREGDPSAGRADTLQLLAVNTKSGAGTLIGIPRDSYVSIPGTGDEKINASLYFGGPERTVQTVSRLAGVPIHYWALIEFSRFRRLVDVLGGVEVKVPYAMADQASGAFFEPGKEKMNGVQALAFARNRKAVPGGDFGRSANHGRLLVAALEKFRADAGDPLKLGKYLKAFDQYVETNVDTDELIELAHVARTIKPWKIRAVVLPGAMGTAGGSSVVLLRGGAKDVFAKVRNDGLL